MNMPSSLRWAIGVAQQAVSGLQRALFRALLQPPQLHAVWSERNSHAVLKKITEKFQKHFQRSFVCL